MNVERMMGSMKSVRIKSVNKETSDTISLEFDLPELDCDINAGEFLMIWVPGVDEIPMSVSLWDAPRTTITIKAIGEATSELSKKEVGDWIGVRGPFGNYFTRDTERALLVGGGIGIAPLRFLAYELLSVGKEVHLIDGAKTKAELILYDFEGIDDNKFHLYITTDDGSLGRKGYVTDQAKDLISNFEFDRIYTCGPELMMAKLHQIAIDNEIPLEASLERYMKCGCGICGTCGMDPNGELVCIDGPVFTGEHLRKIHDFGRSYRDSTGQKKDF